MHNKALRRVKLTANSVPAGDVILRLPVLLCPFSVSQILPGFFHFSYCLLFVGLPSCFLNCSSRRQLCRIASAASSLRMRQIAPPKSAGGREEVSLSGLLLYEIFKVQPRAANCRKSCKRERPKKRSGKKPSTIPQKTGGLHPVFFTIYKMFTKFPIY